MNVRHLQNWCLCVEIQAALRLHTVICPKPLQGCIATDWQIKPCHFLSRTRVYRMRLGIIKFENFVFICFCACLSLYLDNIGCVSAKFFKYIWNFVLNFYYICNVAAPMARRGWAGCINYGKRLLDALFLILGTSQTPNYRREQCNGRCSWDV